jgi:TonB-linked SusC/RagA family outer membrane protein
MHLTLISGCVGQYLAKKTELLTEPRKSQNLLKKMKLMILFLTAACLTANAEGYTQTVTLSLKNVPIQKVFKELSRQTNISIVYNESLFYGVPPVTIVEKNVSIQVVLEKCLKGLPFEYHIEGDAVFIKKKTSNEVTANQLQPLTVIRGTVTDVNGKPLEAVSITIKGSQRGTTTDINGNFSIEANLGEIMIISSIGYIRTETKLSEETINIVLTAELKPLDEVVMVGYGQQKKGNITAAVSSVKSDELSSQPAANVGTILAGRINGAIVFNNSPIPGKENPWIFIRGVNFTQQPLLVIDGVPRYGGLNGGTTGSALQGLNIGSLNPDEIESISILKDNAATSVYGSRGAYGVILITTKKGQRGKPFFHYVNNFSWSNPTRFPERLDAYTYALAVNEFDTNNGLTTPTYSPAKLDAIKNQTDPYTYANTDWYDVLIKKNPLLQTHSLSADGGNESIKYYINGSYTNQDGTVEAYKYERYTLLSNLDIKFNRNLNLSMQTSFRNGTNTGAGGASAQAPAVFNLALQTNPINPVYNKNGSYYGTSETSNPLTGIVPEAGNTAETSNYLTGNATLNYKVPFVDGLSFKGSFNIERGYYYNKVFRSPVKVFVPDANSPNGYRQTGGGTPPTLSEVWGQSNTYNTDISAMYTRQIQKHRFDVLLLATQNTMKGNYNTVSRDGLVTGLQIINAGSTRNQTTSGSASQAGRAGYLGRLNYQFTNKYYAEFTLRADGSTRFPEDNRWGYFPGGSVGWRVSEEKFMKENLKFLNDFKLRFSIGKTGDDNIGSFTYYYTYNPATSANNSTQAYIFGNTYTPSLSLNNSNIPNPQITWAKSLMTNFGFDFSLWDGKLGGSFDIYQKDVTDILRSKSLTIPATFGIGGPIINFAKQQYKGVEFELTHINRLTKDLNYSLRATFTYNKSEVIDYGEAASTPEYLKAQGYSVYKTTVYKSLGFFQSKDDITNWPVDQDGQNNASLKPGDVKYADLNGDKKIDANDQLSYNNMIFPPMGFGFNTIVNYKNFNLNLFFQGGAGNKILVSPPSFSKEYYDNRWTQEHPDAKYARLSSSPNNTPILFPSTLNLYDGDFVRLRNLQLGYHLPNALLRKIGFQSTHIYASATNLLTFSKYKEFDPEVPNVTGAQSGGFYPMNITFGFGLNLGF